MRNFWYRYNGNIILTSIQRLFPNKLLKSTTVLQFSFSQSLVQYSCFIASSSLAHLVQATITLKFKSSMKSLIILPPKRWESITKDK